MIFEMFFNFFYLFMLEIISSENFSFQSYQNKNLEYIKDFIPWTKAQIQLMSDILLKVS